MVKKLFDLQIWARSLIKNYIENALLEIKGKEGIFYAKPVFRKFNFVFLLFWYNSKTNHERYLTFFSNVYISILYTHDNIFTLFELPKYRHLTFVIFFPINVDKKISVGQKPWKCNTRFFIVVITRLV